MQVKLTADCDGIYRRIRDMIILWETGFKGTF